MNTSLKAAKTGSDDEPKRADVRRNRVVEARHCDWSDLKGKRGWPKTGQAEECRMLPIAL